MVFVTLLALTERLIEPRVIIMFPESPTTGLGLSVRVLRSISILVGVKNGYDKVNVQNPQRRKT